MERLQVCMQPASAEAGIAGACHADKALVQCCKRGAQPVLAQSSPAAHAGTASCAAVDDVGLAGFGPTMLMLCVQRRDKSKVRHFCHAQSSNLAE